ncbi:integrin alpha [Nannocystis sp. SCPEA4]|uniref:integrin alpha n=1 Tax=Nannocystis sp. SCPEA4 TaxID=2996787 RepID=UPI0022715EE5|nr:integrin alpha [Nannocystis sp. SCPEA4]MCY1060428.1 integrin alpha [Nannocystis sp. SCPEA4]
MKSAIAITLTSCALFTLATPASASVREFGYEFSRLPDIDDDKHAELAVLIPDITFNQQGTASIAALSGDTGAPLWITDIGDYGDLQFVPIVLFHDLDEDGLKDILVGNSHTGEVYLLSARDGEELAVWTAPAGAPSRFGHTIAPLHQDLDDDGVPEFAVAATGAPHYAGSGVVYIYSGVLEGGLLTTITGPEASGFGFAIAPTNIDHDADGVDEILVSAIGQIHVVQGQAYRGSVHIINPATGATIDRIDNTDDQDLDADNILFGYTLQRTGDLDRGGVDDFIVGAPNIAGTPGVSSISVISGETGDEMCRYDSTIDYDGFGSALAAKWRFDPLTITHGTVDVVVGAPDDGTFGRVYTLRIVGDTAGTCTVTPTFDELGAVAGSYAGNRVALYNRDAGIDYLDEVEWLDPNSLLHGGFIVSQFTDSVTGGTPGSIRYYDSDGVLAQTFVYTP